MLSFASVQNGVVAMGHLLNQTELNEDQRECVETILDSSDAMLKLLNDLLLVSKIGSGRFSLNPAPFRLDHLIKHVTGVMQRRIQQKRTQQPDSQSSEDQLVFRVDRDPSLPCCIIADRDRIRQILLNLIDKLVASDRHTMQPRQSA